MTLRIGVLGKAVFRKFRPRSEICAPVTHSIFLLRALIPVLQGNNGYAGSYEKINPAKWPRFAIGSPSL
jgi:hypothetical protein